LNELKSGDQSEMLSYSYEQVGAASGVSGQTVRKHVKLGLCPGPDRRHLSRNYFTEEAMAGAKAYFASYQPWSAREGSEKAN
jgi:hypothetical protein